MVLVDGNRPALCPPHDGDARVEPADRVVVAVEDAGEKIPVVLHRANNKPWLAIVRLDDLPDLAVQLYLQLESR